MRRFLSSIIASILISTSCAHSAPLAPLPVGGLHVLFIGNSLTYVNDLPATVAAIAAAAGDTVRVASAAGPNLALIDHINGATNALDAIGSGSWDYVVLQQGPTPAGICRDSLVLWTRMFDNRIRNVGATPALFMTWPATNQRAGFDAVRISFQTAAEAVSGVFLPAGEAWRAAWEVDPALALYGPDGFHPSPTGTYLAALTIYERLSGRDARTLPRQAFASGRSFVLPDSTIRLLQQAAHGANQKYSPRSATRPASPVPQATSASRTRTQC